MEGALFEYQLGQNGIDPESLYQRSPLCLDPELADKGSSKRPIRMRQFQQAQRCHAPNDKRLCTEDL